jgi:hypothetical protein
LPRATLVATRSVLAFEWKRLLLQQLDAGLSHEGMAFLAQPTMAAAESTLSLGES